ncbi:MAG: HD domain-containing protein [Firmicutes bacterium]|nr:HD domain-containing protein [Bacillota bacterium]
MTKEEKKIIGHKAVNNILDNLLDKEEIFKIIVEFDERNTKEALFAHYCDKLECDIQSRLYDLEGCVDLNNQEGNESRNNELVKELLDSGMSFSEMWLTFGQRKYNYDDNFLEVSEYAKNNKIKDLKQY